MQILNFLKIPILVEFSAYIYPIAVLTDTNRSLAGYEGTISGWGWGKNGFASGESMDSNSDGKGKNNSL